MPLSDDEIRQRRSIPAEARRDNDIARIADALENIEAVLGKINDRLAEQHAMAGLPGGSSFKR